MSCLFAFGGMVSETYGGSRRGNYVVQLISYLERVGGKLLFFFCVFLISSSTVDVFFPSPLREFFCTSRGDRCLPLFPPDTCFQCNRKIGTRLVPTAYRSRPIDCQPVDGENKQAFFLFAEVTCIAAGSSSTPSLIDPGNRCWVMATCPKRMHTNGEHQNKNEARERRRRRIG